jgi:CubicO group peptidase (beta-lactamase class C family)
MNQFAHALTRLAGEPLDDLLQRRILDPIGMDRQAWHWGDLGERDGLRIVNGSGNHTRMNISARALARFGQLYLHQGCWAGRQLLAPAWVQAASAVQVPATLPLKGFVQHGPGTYGFNWWVNGIGPDGARKWPSAPAGTFCASGFNNNDLFVIPEWDMVIVRLGLDENERAISDAAHDRFLGLVGAALI